MTPEKFIKDNPFPANGSELNAQLIADIQNPEKQHLRQHNLEKLLKVNARLIYIVWSQYNYANELASIMSYVYQGLTKASESFNPDLGVPFYNYAIKVTRGLLQNNYNYTASLIHTPVMKRKLEIYDPTIGEHVKLYDFKYSDINDYSEHQSMVACDDTDDDDIKSELDMAFTEYEATLLTDTARADLEVLKMSSNMTLKDISTKTGINTAKLRKIIDRTTIKMQIFFDRQDTY